MVQPGTGQRLPRGPKAEDLQPSKRRMNLKLHRSHCAPPPPPPAAVHSRPRATLRTVTESLAHTHHCANLCRPRAFYSLARKMALLLNKPAQGPIQHGFQTLVSDLKAFQAPHPHPHPNGWATNPPKPNWRIPSSKGAHECTSGSTNRHTPSACMAHPSQFKDTASNTQNQCKARVWLHWTALAALIPWKVTSKK